MSLTFYPNVNRPKGDEYVNSVLVTRKLVIPSFETIAEIGVPQVGSIAYVKSLQTLFIGGSGAWTPIQAQTSNITLAPGAVGSSIIFNGTGPNLSFKRIQAGSGVNITSSATDLTINIVGPPYVAGIGIDITAGVVSNTLPAIVYTAGTGLNFAGTVLNSTGVNTVTSGDTVVAVTGTQSNRVVTLGYQAGTNINITGNVISSTLPLGVDTISAGDSTIVIGGTASNPTVRCNYTAGTGMSITGTNTINATLSPIVSSVVAGDTTVSITGSFNTVISGNYQGSGQISIVGNTISSSIYVTSVTAANSTIVVGGLPATPSLSSGYVAGSEISIVGNVINVVPTTVVTITPVDSTITVNSATPNNVITGNYQGGTGISIAGNVISIPSPHIQSVSAGDSTVFVGGTSTNPTLSGNYQNGPGIAITGNVISTGQFQQKYLNFTTGGESLTISPTSTATYFISQYGTLTSSITNANQMSTGVIAEQGLMLTDLAVTVSGSGVGNVSSLTKVFNVLVNGLPTSMTSTLAAGNYTTITTVTGASIYVPQYSVVSFTVDVTNPTATPTPLYVFATATSDYKNTVSILSPPDVTGVSGVAATTSITLSWTAAGGTTIGHRIIYKTGAVPPSSWNDPTGTQIFEASIYGNSRQVSRLTTLTTYSFLIFTINGNTPPTMSSGVAFTFSTV